MDEAQSLVGDRGMWGCVVMPSSRRLGWPVKADRWRARLEKRQEELRQVLVSTLMPVCFLLKTGKLEGSGGHWLSAALNEGEEDNVPPTTTHCCVGAGAVSGEGTPVG